MRPANVERLIEALTPHQPTVTCASRHRTPYRLLSPLLLSSLALAQQGPPTHDDDTVALRRELAGARQDVAELRELIVRPDVVTGSWGVDLTNEYFFRGILQENQGVVAQPWVAFGYQLAEDLGALRELDLTFGLWNSLHSGPTGGAGSVWYESDFYTDLTAKLGERWSIGTTFTLYTSPNGSFGTVQEPAFHLGFDDSDAWFGRGLQPSLTVAFETAGQADGGHGEGIYAQLGIEPAFALGAAGGFDLQLKLPMKLGMSLHDYYENPVTGKDDAFGYVDVGAVLSTALPGIPRRFGPWQLAAGLHYLVLGDGNGDRNGGQDQELLVTLGLSTSF